MPQAPKRTISFSSLEELRVALGAGAVARAAALDLTARCDGDLEELVPGLGELLVAAHPGDGLAVGAHLVGEVLRRVGVEPVADRLHLAVAHRDRALADVDVALRAGVARVLRVVGGALVGRAVLVGVDVARALHILVALLPDVVNRIECLRVRVGEAVLRIPRGDRRATVLAVERVAGVAPVADDVTRSLRLLEGLEVLCPRELHEGVTHLHFGRRAVERGGAVEEADDDALRDPEARR